MKGEVGFELALNGEGPGPAWREGLSTSPSEGVESVGGAIMWTAGMHAKFKFMGRYT